MTAARIVVVGGGVTGLAAAHALERARRVHGAALTYTLVEGSERLGGNLRTVREDGFVVDVGPDGFVASKPHATALCREVGLGDALMGTLEENRKVYVLRRGRMVRMPEGMLLAAPTQFGAMARTPLLSFWGKLRVALDLVLPARPADDESIASFLTRRMGREAAEILGEPMLAGIYAGDPRALSMYATFPQLVAMEREHGSLIRGAMAARRARRQAPGAPPPSAFFSLPDGLESLVHAVAARLEPSQVRTQTRVTALDRGTSAGDPAWTVRLATGDSLPADHVVLAVPAHVAARLLERYDAEAAGTLQEIPHVSTAAAFFGFERDDVAHPLDATGVLVPHGEGLAMTASTWASSKWPGRAPEGKVLLRVFLGGALTPAAMDRDDDVLLDLALADLTRVVGVRGRPVLRKLTRYTRLNPQPTLGHQARMRRVRARLAPLSGLHVGGGGYDGVGIPDCVKQGEALAANVLAEVARAQA